MTLFFLQKVSYSLAYYFASALKATHCGESAELRALPITDMRLTRPRALPIINKRLRTLRAFVLSSVVLLQLKDKVRFVCSLQ